jgi:hypothetical protein
MLIQFRCYGYRAGGVDCTIENPVVSEVMWSNVVPPPALGDLVEVKHEQPELECDMHIWAMASMFRVVRRGWHLCQGYGTGAASFILVLWLAHQDSPDAQA